MREDVLTVMGWTAATVFKAIVLFLLLFCFFFVFIIFGIQAFGTEGGFEAVINSIMVAGGVLIAHGGSSSGAAKTSGEDALRRIEHRVQLTLRKQFTA